MKFRKKPVVIDAFQWTGGQEQTEDPEWIVDALNNGKAIIRRDDPYVPNGLSMHISTPEGDMMAVPGDYIIRGIKGELYPCKPDIFKATYEEVTNAAPTGEHDG